MTFRGALQVHHVDELLSRLEDGVIVVVEKEVRDGVGPSETAFLIEGNSQRAVSGSHLEQGKIPAELFFNVADQGHTITVPLAFRLHCDVLDLQETAALVCDHALGLHASVVQNEHPAPGQVGFDHLGLLVRKQEQGHIRSFFLMNFVNLHVRQSSFNLIDKKSIRMKHAKVNKI